MVKKILPSNLRGHPIFFIKIFSSFLHLHIIYISIFTKPALFTLFSRLKKINYFNTYICGFYMKILKCTSLQESLRIYSGKYRRPVGKVFARRIFLMVYMLLCLVGVLYFGFERRVVILCENQMKGFPVLCVYINLETWTHGHSFSLHMCEYN